MLNKNSNNSNSTSNTNNTANLNSSGSSHEYKKNSLGKIMRNINLTEPKFLEYKRRWNEVLKRDRRNFDAKWHGYTPNRTHSLDDFQLKRTLGNGSFGRVVLAKCLKDGKFYALKVLEKRNVVRSKQIEHTLNEKKIISCINFPFFVTYFESFKVL
jgi:hypothetical protein